MRVARILSCQGLLRLAERNGQSQIAETKLMIARSVVVRVHSQANLRPLRSYFFLLAATHFLPFGAFASTISYDCRIRSRSSSFRSASSRSSLTHL